jgi:hypothetical protein
MACHLNIERTSVQLLCILLIAIDVPGKTDLTQSPLLFLDNSKGFPEPGLICLQSCAFSQYTVLYYQWLTTLINGNMICAEPKFL